MHIFSLVLQVILGLLFVMAGFMKLGAKQQVEAFDHYRYPQWFRVITGLVEIAGAAGMIIGIWYQMLAPLAGLWLAVTMFGAVITHIRVKDPAKVITMPFILLLLNVLVVIFQWNALAAS